MQVQRGDLPAFELRVVREEAREHPPHPVAEPRVEVVEDELGTVARGRAVAAYLLGHDERRQLESSRGAVGQLDDPEAGDRRFLLHDVLLGVVLGEDEKVGEATLDPWPRCR